MLLGLVTGFAAVAALAALLVAFLALGLALTGSTAGVSVMAIGATGAVWLTVVIASFWVFMLVASFFEG
jgi:hypothetical protein